jgi:CRISPR-associated protein Cas2
MLILVSYDVKTSTEGGARRLRRVAKQCSNYGQRVQYSVFECIVDITQYETLKHKILNIIDEEQDSIRFYVLGNNYQNKVEHYGAKKSVDLEGLLIL